MTKTTKSERKWGKDIEKKPPKKNINKKDKSSEKVIEKYKILIDGSGFSKAMSYEECIKVIGEMEAQALKMRHAPPSLMLVKQ